MIMLLKFVVMFALALAVTGVQKYLSTRKRWQLGAIVPLIFTAVLTGIYFAKQIPLDDFIFPCAALVFLEVLVWAEGRYLHRKKELVKMKAKDID